MNRCSKIIKATFFIAVCATFTSAGVLFPSEARAERAFPLKAERAEMAFVALPDVTINGRPERLPHYVRVRNERNTVVMPGIINGSTAVVNYVRNGRGEVSEVWILSPQEVAVPLKPVPIMTKPLPISSDALPSYAN